LDGIRKTPQGKAGERKPRGFGESRGAKRGGENEGTVKEPPWKFNGIAKVKQYVFYFRMLRRSMGLGGFFRAFSEVIGRIVVVGKRSKFFCCRSDLCS